MKTFVLLSILLTSTFLFSAEINCVPLPDSNEDMLHCKTKINSYPEVIHFYIPQHLSSNLPLQLFTHFHGHNLAGYDHFSKIYGDYGSYLLSSNANAVLIIPESLGNCTTYDNFFADQVKAEQFFLEIENEVESMTSKKINSLALSGHSGAYRVLNRLIGYTNKGLGLLKLVSAVGMFDATYGPTPEINKWTKNNSDQKNNFLFYDAFVTGSNATAEDGSLALKKQFKDLSPDKIIFISVLGHDSESVLDQHFNILKRGSLTSFWKRASSF
jgi:hypothetical protein